jgi:hypothetical protein
MKTTKTNLINELSLRVYSSIAEKQLINLLIDGQPLMEVEEISEYIKNNLDEYLCLEEQKQLVIDNLGIKTDNEELKSMVLDFAIELAGLYVYAAIQKALSSTEFVGDNPYSVQSNSQLFMMHKYFDEKLGVKLSYRDSGLTAPI